MSGETPADLGAWAEFSGDLSLPRILFLILAAVALIGAVMVVLPRTSAVHSALYLVVTFFAIGGHFVLLNAQFLAAVHILVYAGAIMVLFLFVIMLLNQRGNVHLKRPALGWIAAACSATLLLVALVASLSGETKSPEIGPDRGIGLVGSIGKSLFSDFRAPFELASMLFLAAIVGVVLLSRKPRQPEATE